jgi:hypothetical protein
MKYLNIHLPHAVDGSLIYPSGYQLEIGNLCKDHLYYNNDVGEDYLLLAFEDTDFNGKMIKESCEEMTEEDALALSESKEKRTLQITDEAKIRLIEIKSRLGTELTADEQAALDPNDPTPGFSTTNILADRVNDLKTVEAVKVSKAQLLK